MASFVKKEVKNEDYELEVTYDGRMGQPLLNQNRYGLVVLGVNRPYSNGFELCRQIRQHDPR